MPIAVRHSVSLVVLTFSVVCVVVMVVAGIGEAVVSATIVSVGVFAFAWTTLRIKPLRPPMRPSQGNQPPKPGKCPCFPGPRNRVCTYDSVILPLGYAPNPTFVWPDVPDRVII